MSKPKMKPIKIAVIDDDVAIAELYRMKFAADGFDVQTASNGMLGYELVKEMNPDLILLDLMMPVQNGEECLARIRAEEWGKDVKVIVLTNIGDEAVSKELLSMNILNFILKSSMTPSEIDSLVRKYFPESED